MSFIYTGMARATALSLALRKSRLFARAPKPRAALLFRFCCPCWRWVDWNLPRSCCLLCNVTRKLYDNLYLGILTLRSKDATSLLRDLRRVFKSVREARTSSIEGLGARPDPLLSGEAKTLPSLLLSACELSWEL